MVVSDFRSTLKEFSNSAQYSDDDINLWIGLASEAINAALVGNRRTIMMCYYIAHHLTLARRDQAAANAATPGQATGLISGKSAGGITISYNNSATTNEKAGHWNLTTYGTRFYSLARMAGAGGVQL